MTRLKSIVNRKGSQIIRFRSIKLSAATADFLILFTAASSKLTYFAIRGYNSTFDLFSAIASDRVEGETRRLISSRRASVQAWMFVGGVVILRASLRAGAVGTGSGATTENEVNQEYSVRNSDRSIAVGIRLR